MLYDDDDDYPSYEEEDEEFGIDNGIEIYTEVFDKDFDDINFDGDDADDSDELEAERYGLK
jgi:hypothetical protein